MNTTTFDREPKEFAQLCHSRMAKVYSKGNWTWWVY